MPETGVPSPSKATLRQVAEATGVSAMTVSRAFRQGSSIRPQLRERILSAARKMGYAPDPLISSTMRAVVRRKGVSYRGTIAFVAARAAETGSQLDLALQGARLRAESHGYRLDPFWHRDRRMTFSRLSRLLRNRSIRGVILHPSGSSPHLHARLDWVHFATVAIGSSLWKPRIHRVQSHHYMGMIVALRALRRRVGKRIGLVISDSLHSHSQGTYVSSFLSNQAGSLRDLSPRIHRYAAWNAGKFLHWLERIRPEALLCSTADEASWAAQALAKERGKKRSTPSLHIASLDAPPGLPHLAGIDQHYETIGANTVDLLLAELQQGEYGIPKYPKTLMIEGSWHDGPSLHFQAGKRA